MDLKVLYFLSLPPYPPTPPPIKMLSVSKLRFKARIVHTIPGSAMF